MIQETSRQPRISPLAGQPAPKEMLIDVSRIEREYHARKPDMDDPNQRVAFGTSGHRGSSLGHRRRARGAAAPSGTENIYKLYAESFRDQAHLDAIVSEAQEILSSALRSAPSS